MVKLRKTNDSTLVGTDDVGFVFKVWGTVDAMHTSSGMRPLTGALASAPAFTPECQ